MVVKIESNSATGRIIDCMHEDCNNLKKKNPKLTGFKNKKRNAEKQVVRKFRYTH